MGVETGLLRQRHAEQDTVEHEHVGLPTDVDGKDGPLCTIAVDARCSRGELGRSRTGDERERLGRTGSRCSGTGRRGFGTGHRCN